MYATVGKNRNENKGKDPFFEYDFLLLIRCLDPNLESIHFKIVQKNEYRFIKDLTNLERTQMSNKMEMGSHGREIH